MAYLPYASAPIYAYVCRHPTHKPAADAHDSEQLQIRNYASHIVTSFCGKCKRFGWIGAILDAWERFYRELADLGLLFTGKASILVTYGNCYFREQRARQPGLHRYLAAAARGCRVHVALDSHRPKRSADQIPRPLGRVKFDASLLAAWSLTL